MDITINIEDAKYKDFKDGLLKIIDVHRPPELKALSEDDYIKQWIASVLINTYRTGKMTIAKEATNPSIDLTILEVK